MHTAQPGQSAKPSPLRYRLRAATMLVPLAGGALLLAASQFDLGSLIGAASAQTARPTLARTPALGPAAAPVAPAANPAVAVLLERANFWRDRSQYDQALESLNRALDLDPRNADALALIGQIQAERGNNAAAQAALTKLRQAAPGDPRIDKIDQAVRVGAIPPEALADARRLAREGRLPEAVDRYNRVFRGNPPPDRLAVEYYQTVAGTEGGWEKARDGLARTVRENPQDVRSQLAYAQILTYRDGARTDGINRLALLARNPAVSEASTTAWRQALNWLPNDPSAVPALTEYLASHPNDGDVRAKIEAARNPPPDPNDPAAKQRIAAFDQLNRGRLNEAATAFQAAIEANPNDADAVGGLGVVRLRQRRLDEARTLLNRAIALEPANRGRWQPALNGVSAAVAGSQPNPATTLMERGDYPAAEAEIQRQIARGSGDTAALYAMLADAQARQNRTGPAEQSYRAALQRNPRYAPALVGLAGIIGPKGQHDEAISLLRQAEAAGGDRRLVGQARALQLREQAQSITDPVTQTGLFREAIAADPTNPWIKLDYARALVKQGAVREARAVMAQAVAGNASTEAVRAGIVFANETSDPDAAQALLARIPPNQRTADMRQLYANASLQREIGQVIDLPRTTARARLLAMAAQPDPDGTRGAAIARALSSIGDSASARRAIIVARDATPNQGNAARIAYAGALLDVGDATGAQIMLNPLRNGGGLNPSQLAAFTQLRAGLAVKTADDLNQAGRQAEGYDKLAPALAADPDNTDMNLALARLYAGAKDPREALEINEALLKRDPANAEARRGAVAAALLSNNRRRAEQLVAEGLEIAPDDPKSWMASADVARANGNNARALRDLQRARELRLQQLGYSDNGDDDSTLTHVTLAPGDQPVNMRTRPQVKIAAFGSNQPPSSATYTYANPEMANPAVAAPKATPITPAKKRQNADHGDDVIPPLAIPPGLGTAPLPVPTRPTQLRPGAAPAPVATAPLPAPAPVYAPTPQVAPQFQPQPAAQQYQQQSAPQYRPQTVPPGDGQSTAPFGDSSSATLPARRAAAPTSSPAPAGVYGAPRRSVLDTTNPDTLPAPVSVRPPQRPAADYTGTADQLNARQLGGFGQQPSYAAPGSPAPVYPAPNYPAYATPAYATPQPPTVPPTYPAAPPAYTPPQFVQQQYNVPSYPSYAPPPGTVFQPSAAVQQQIPSQLMYQPQAQEYLPQYRPAPPPSAGQAAADDDALFRRNDDFNRPYRPSLPRLGDNGELPFGRDTRDQPSGFYDNPFRHSPDNSIRASAGLPPGTGTVGPDPVTQEIDRSIVQLRDTVAPSVQAGFGFRVRSGDTGLDKLTEVNVPVEATFQPGGAGELKLRVQPTVITGGSIGTTGTNVQRFGTSALHITPAVQGPPYVAAVYTGLLPSSQNAQGVAAGLGYTNRWFGADIGTTPVGFRIQNVVGGVELSPQLNDRLRLRVGVERRAVTDSVLSYAGTVDTNTGKTWGGVVKNRGHAALEFSAGQADFYVNGGGGSVTGSNVASNTEVDAGAGGSYPIYKEGSDEIRVGVDLAYLNYSKNLSYFTYGQGGYFSPQNFISAMIPITYRSKVDEDLNYELGASIGLQSFTQNRSDYFPRDAQLQAQLNAVPGFSGLSTYYPSKSQSGVAGAIHGKFDYRVSPSLFLGGAASFQNIGNFNEAVGSLYARYVFNGTDKR